MNSAMTMTALENGLNVSLDSKKTAKLGREKVINIKNKFQKYMQGLNKQEVVSNVTPVLAQETVPNYKRILDTFNLSVLNNGNEVVRQTGARKLKVNPIVRDSSKKMYNSCIKDGIAIKKAVAVEVSKPVKEVTINEPISNVVPFPKMQNVAPTREVEMPSRVENNIVKFPSQPAVSQPTMNNEPSLSNFSRVMRMDYNSNPTTTQNVEKPVEEKVQRDNTVSIDDYLQHGSNNGDKDIAELLQTNEKLDSEIGRNQSILENLEAELKRIQEIREEKRRAKLNALEEERLSKTATLNGLTEQIRALQEAIRLEQQNLNETSSYRRVA